MDRFHVWQLPKSVTSSPPDFEVVCWTPITTLAPSSQQLPKSVTSSPPDLGLVCWSCQKSCSTHRGPKSGGELVTLFESYSGYGVSAVIGVQYTKVPNLGGVLVELFDSYCNDGVSAVIGVQYTEVPNLGASLSRFLTVTVMMV